MEDCYLGEGDASISEAQNPRRKISSEFSSLAVTQHIDSWSSNLLDLFGDGSRKGSVSNLQPLGVWPCISKFEDLKTADNCFRLKHSGLIK